MSDDNYRQIDLNRLAKKYAFVRSPKKVAYVSETPVFAPAVDGYYEDGQLIIDEPDGYWVTGSRSQIPDGYYEEGAQIPNEPDGYWEDGIRSQIPDGYYEEGTVLPNEPDGYWEDGIRSQIPDGYYEEGAQIPNEPDGYWEDGIRSQIPDGYYEEGDLVPNEPDGYWIGGTKIASDLTDGFYLIKEGGINLITYLYTATDENYPNMDQLNEITYEAGTFGGFYNVGDLE
jgi:hypothetical protein